MIRPRRTWLYALVASGHLIPHPWLGFAWRRWEIDAAVYLPIPLNWLARWSRAAWLFLRFPRAENRYDRGYIDGWNDAVSRGAPR